MSLQNGAAVAAVIADVNALAERLYADVRVSDCEQQQPQDDRKQENPLEALYENDPNMRRVGGAKPAPPYIVGRYENEYFFLAVR